MGEPVCYTMCGDTLEVRPSVGKGLGVFAVVSLPRGRFLGCYGGELRFDSEVVDSSSEYLFSLGDGRNLDAARDCSGTNWTRFLNHCSREPNVEARICRDAGLEHMVFLEDGSWIEVEVPPGPRVEFWTRADIQAGDELCFDYGREFGAILDRGCLAQ